VPSIIGFPATVDERAARTVAGGVVTMAATAAATDRLWLTAPLAYGFAARVLTGPRLSPLGLLASRVVAPRLPGDARPVPGHPKRLAQGMGLTLSTTALVLVLGLVLGRRQAARTVLAVLVMAAGLEAFAGVCLACKLYPLLVRAGLAPEAGCPEGRDISLRHRHGDR
jgi:hypothetical protein